MPMPKGFKAKHGYGTVTDVDGGCDYRTIAEKMTKKGFKMNHATARNVLLSALYKIARPLHQLNDRKMSQEEINITTKDPRFQSGLAEILESFDRR